MGTLFTYVQVHRMRLLMAEFLEFFRVIRISWFFFELFHFSR